MKSLQVALAAITLGTASASEVLIDADIAVSTTWTADNTYNLQRQIYVLPGATLTIEPGTVVASDTGGGGSLAVCRSAQLFALGQSGAPVIFTSKADVETWVGGDPRTGYWRESANEWGNITIMGAGYISENAITTNSSTPSASNFGNMEGLTPPAGSSIGQYGGGNDNDDSGTLNFVSIRYGGKVEGLGNELNGLSLGGVGRGTDIDHIEILNNVDDGIEIWGGAVNLRHFAIWNVGDDSLDVDQGWRGKAQFGLIVQGFSLDANQGSGVGDNCIELDGAENADFQPITTTTMYNLTVIGQPADGDGATAWRDNARAQFRNCIFMDCGEKLIRFDNDDGDGARGYEDPSTGDSADGTLDWEGTWAAPYTQFPTVNAPANLASFYPTQSSGNLIEFKGNIFYRNVNGSAYAEAIARGVLDASQRNVVAIVPPIVASNYGPPVTRGGKTMLPRTLLDVRPANDALVAGMVAPEDGFFERANYCGAFSPDTSSTWLAGWSAAEAYGLVPRESPVGIGFCEGAENSTGQVAQLRASGSTAVGDNDLRLEASALPRASFGFFVASRETDFVEQPAGSEGNLCLGGEIGRYVGPGQISGSGQTGVIGLSIDLAQVPQPLGSVAVQPGESWSFQGWYRDSVAGQATSNFTHGVTVTFE